MKEWQIRFSITSMLASVTLLVVQLEQFIPPLLRPIGFMFFILTGLGVVNTLDAYWNPPIGSFGRAKKRDSR